MKQLTVLTLAVTAFIFSACTKRVEDAKFRFVDYEKVAGPYWQITEIQFADALNGMMLVDYESVFRTSDGGKTWQFIYSDPGTVRTIAYPQKDTAYVYVQPSSNDDHDVFRSIDGGQTWTAVAPLADYVVVDFYNGKNGFAYAAIPPSNQERIIKTTNAGVTWTNAGNQSIGSMYDLQFVNATRGFVILSGFRMTTDGGVTWTPTWNDVRGFSHMSPEGVCYITDHNGMYKTTDYGATWNPCLTLTEYALSTVDFYGQFVVAVSGTQFVVSRDGGATWENYLFRDAADMEYNGLQDVYVLDEHHVLVTGALAGYNPTSLFNITFP